MNAKPVVENRLTPRYVLDQRAEFLDVSSFAANLVYQVCVLVDISLGGVKIRSQTKYKSGHFLNLRASLCDCRNKIVLRGKILRAVPLSDGWYEYGVSFDGLSDCQQRALRNGLECIARCKQAIA